MLDLEVLSGGIDQIARSIVFTDIPGTVDPFVKTFIKRVLYKNLRGFFGIPVITQSQTGSSDTDLSFHVGLGVPDQGIVLA